MTREIPETNPLSEKKMQLQPGVLTLVGTPIGNLDDLSWRAAAALSEADLIAAEDTRRTRQLLNHLGLKKRMISYHQHNFRQREAYLISQLQDGCRLIVVCDAGMPGISDPGSALVAACAAASIPVTAIPGPSAFLIALVVSGLETDRFVFEGFLPVSGRRRSKILKGLPLEPRTIVLYEAPHRLRQTVGDLVQSGLASRRIALVRELTKRFETITRTTLGEAHESLQDDMIRGEYVLVVEGLEAYARRVPQREEPDDAPEADQIMIRTLLDENRTVRDVVRLVSAQSSRSRNELYQMTLKMEQQKKRKA